MSEAAEKFTPPTRGVSVDIDTVRARLSDWLGRRYGAEVAIRSITSPGAAGVNNETLLLDIDTAVPELKAVDGLVVRLEAPTTLFPGMDVVSSYKCYEALQDEPCARTPKVFGLEEDTSVLGRRFFVMERISGQIPADNPTYHHSGFVKDLPVPQRRQLWENAVRTMARLHKVPTEKFSFLYDMGVGSARQQMDYWRRYMDDYRPAGEEYPLIEKTWDWVVANVPADLEDSFAWGDARVPNMIFQGLDCVGILDWDMVSLAGPECDVAWWLVNDIAGAVTIGRLEGLHDARDMVRVWEDEYGRKAKNMEFWLMFNLFRMGAIMVNLKAFLIGLGTPLEAVANLDRANTGMSIMHSRWYGGEGTGQGSWSDVSGAIGA